MAPNPWGDPIHSKLLRKFFLPPLLLFRTIVLKSSKEESRELMCSSGLMQGGGSGLMQGLEAGSLLSSVYAKV